MPDNHFLAWMPNRWTLIAQQKPSEWNIQKIIRCVVYNYKPCIEMNLTLINHTLSRTDQCLWASEYGRVHVLRFKNTEAEGQLLQIFDTSIDIITRLRVAEALSLPWIHSEPC